MIRGNTDRETCELNNFIVGDILEGDEGYGPTRILLTAIGQKKLLAKCLSHPGKTLCDHEESSWTLSQRKWKKVGKIEF